MPKALHFKRSELPFIPCKMEEGETKIARVINKEISHNMGGGLEIGENVCIHWTTLYDEILFIHEGSMIVRTDQGEYECKAGDIVWRDHAFPKFLVEYLIEFPPPDEKLAKWN